MKNLFAWLKKPVTWGASLLVGFISAIIAAAVVLAKFGAFSMIGEKFRALKEKIMG